jgi:hypothetical protein
MTTPNTTLIVQNVLFLCKPFHDLLQSLAYPQPKVEWLTLRLLVTWPTLGPSWHWPCRAVQIPIEDRCNVSKAVGANSDNLCMTWNQKCKNSANQSLLNDPWTTMLGPFYFWARSCHDCWRKEFSVRKVTPQIFDYYIEILFPNQPGTYSGRRDVAGGYFLMRTFP